MSIDIIGHERELGILKKAASGERCAHSFIFSGPEGIGKRLTALAFAKALNCEGGGGRGPDGDLFFCGACSDCKQIDEGTHINLFQTGPLEGVIRIDQVRELQNSLVYRVERGTKVAIVLEAEKLKPEASNAFLKTLEEPPGGSVIILVTSRASDLLPTVVSRCQRINFRPLGKEAVAKYLVEEKGLDKEEAGLVSTLSQGSLSRALRLLDGSEREKRKELAARLSRLKPSDADLILDFAGELSSAEDLDGVLEFLKSWVRDIVVVSEGFPELAVNCDMLDYMGNGGAFTGALPECYSMIEGARRSIMPPRYANKQLAMENLLFELVKIMKDQVIGYGKDR